MFFIFRTVQTFAKSTQHVTVLISRSVSLILAHVWRGFPVITAILHASLAVLRSDPFWSTLAHSGPFFTCIGLDLCCPHHIRNIYVSFCFCSALFAPRSEVFYYWIASNLQHSHFFLYFVNLFVPLSVCKIIFFHVVSSIEYKFHMNKNCCVVIGSCMLFDFQYSNDFDGNH